MCYRDSFCDSLCKYVKKMVAAKDGVAIKVVTIKYARCIGEKIWQI